MKKNEKRTQTYRDNKSKPKNDQRNRNIILCIMIVFGFGFIILSFINLYSINIFLVGAETTDSLFSFLNINTFENVDNTIIIDQIILASRVSLIIGSVIILFALYLLINNQKSEFLKITFIAALFSIPTMLIIISGGL
jgi:hypothetical protein